MLKMLAICRKIADDLKCSIPDLAIEELPTYVQGMYYPSYKRLVISYDSLNSDIPTLIAILAHEMRHHWQNEVGKLRTNDSVRTLLWGGKEYLQSWGGSVLCKATGANVSYDELPWEIDANNYASNYCAQLAKKETKTC